MEFKLTIDITDKLADALSALSASIAEASRKKSPPCVQESPECTEAPEPVIIQAEPESAKIAPPEPQESAPVNDDEPVADCAGVQIHCPTPAQALPVVTGDADAAQAPVEPEKPKKKKSAKKSAKKAVETPAPVEVPQPEPPAVKAPEKPAPAKAEPVKTDDAPKAPDGDPMGGMTVMDAVQALFDEIQEKGLDMADVNARVRTKANELGLSYSSIACLIKAVGYVEARRIALGE